MPPATNCSSWPPSACNCVCATWTPWAAWGGDEFVVVLERVGSEEGAAEVAGALVEQLSSPFLLSSGRQVRIGASVGISLFPRDAERWDELLDRADVALYSAKNGGRGRWCFAAPDRSPFAPFTADPASLPAAGGRVSPG